MSLIGAAVSISGFVAVVMAKSMKSWVRSHPYAIYFALIVAILVLAGSLDYAYNLRKRLARPTDHDAKLYVAMLSALPADGTVIGWLKRTDITATGITDFPADVLAALTKAAEYASLCPVGFDNPRLAASYQTLIGAIMGFCTAVEHWTVAVQANRGSLAGTAGVTALGCGHRELIRAYDGFVRTAHASGIDTDG